MLKLGFPQLRTLLFLSCLPCLCQAEWVEIHADESTQYYYDLSTRLSGNKPRISALRSFRQPTAHGDQSARLLYEADCANKKIRLMSGVYTKNKTGDGEVSGMINSNGWMDPSSRIVLEKLFAALCEPNSTAQ
jgi:hypothetical protein